MAHPISSSRDPPQKNNNTQNNDIIPHNAIMNSWWSDKRWIAKTLISSEPEILLDQRLRHNFWVSREIVEKDWLQPPLPQETFTLSDVYWLASRPASDNEINAENGSGDFELEQLAILEMTLNRLYTVEPKAIRKTTFQRQDNTDLVVIGNLSLWISKTILPKGSIFLRDEVSEDVESAARPPPNPLTGQKACLGLMCLFHLQEILDRRLSEQSELKPPIPDPKVLLAFLAFTSQDDPYTLSSVFDLSITLIDRHMEQLSSEAFIVYYLVEEVIRPLFPPPSSSTSARQATLPSSTLNISPSSKPWKYEVPYALTVLTWAVVKIPKAFLKYHYRLLLPPILTILQDTTLYPRAQTRALNMVSTLLHKLPESEVILHQTGLGTVIEQAIFRNLYLPHLTPSTQPIPMLCSAYEAIFALYDARFPGVGSNDTPYQASEKEKQRTALLARIMREALMPSFHRNLSPRHLELLMLNMKLLILKLDIEAVRFIGPIIAMFNRLFSDPDSYTGQSAVVEGCKALDALLTRVWMRMDDPVYKMMIIDMLVRCWKRDKMDTKTRLALMSTGRRFMVCVQSNQVHQEMRILGDLELLFQQDESLRQLFGVTCG